MYNRLLTNRHRAQYAREQGRALSERRYSGRSTIIALTAIAEAINKPQEWIAVVDHYAHAKAIHHVELARRAMQMAGDLNLVYFERDRNMIRSCHMTPNQLELK